VRDWLVHPSGYVAVFLTAEDAEKKRSVLGKGKDREGRARREMQERKSIGFNKKGEEKDLVFLCGAECTLSKVAVPPLRLGQMSGVEGVLWFEGSK